MSDELETEIVEVFPPTPCGFCGETGLRLVGWDEDGSDILEPCNECGGDGIL